jgi:MraZ protein
MAAFIGNIDAKLDEKGRVFVPASFRKVLGFDDKRLKSTEEERPVLYLRKDPDRKCLVIYPENIWEKKLNDLNSRLDEWDPDDQAILTQFVKDAAELSLDTQGRVLIPRRHLEQIDAMGELLFIGGVDRFTVWAKGEYEKVELSPADFAQKLRDKMKRKSENETNI